MSVGGEARATLQGATEVKPAVTVRQHVELPAARACIVVAVVAVPATLGLSRLEGVDGVFSPVTVHTAIESISTVVPALAASLFWGRARRTATQMDVLMAASLAILAIVNLWFSLVPCLTAPDRTVYGGSAGVAARFVAIAGFATAAWLPDTPLAQPRTRIRRLVVLALLLVVALAAVAVGAEAENAGHVTRTPTGSLERDLITSGTLESAVQVFGLALYAGVVLGFVRRAVSRGDELLGWFAVAMTLATVARLDFLVTPESWVGDVTRCLAFLTLLTGCAREIASYQRRVAEAVVLRERRRMARDLHDGLAQELAYITVQSRRLAGDTTERQRAGDELVAAAERALEESRLAIAALNRPTHEPLDRSIEDAARSTAARAGVEVDFDLQRDIEVAPEVREALLRIIREAIGNAARHGEASEVWITLRADRRLLMRVSDNGRGFDPAAPRRPDSMGLDSMRERIEALGGRLLIDSAPGTGTRLEVELQ